MVFMRFTRNRNRKIEFISFVAFYTCLMKRNNNGHILFLARWYPHQYDPMFGLFVQRHALAVKPFRDVSVIYIHSDQNIAHKQENLSETGGVLEVKEYYPKSRFQTRFLNPLRYLQSFIKAYRTLRKIKPAPALIHVNVLTRAGVIALMMKYLFGIPYIITEHWSRYLPSNDSYTGRVRKLATRLVVHNAKAVTTVTRNLKEAMENRGLKNRNYFIVPNVVDTHFFKPSPSAGETITKTKTLIHVSCFEERSKNMSGILRVIRKLSEKRNDFQIYMVGEGEDLDRTIKMAGEMGLKDRYVHFTGLKQGEELLELMQLSDLMVMFSHYENLPVVILEAFACGIPVISSDVGGIREHLTKERGGLVPPEDEETFLVEINSLLDRLDSFDKHAIRDYAVKHFSKEAIGQQFNEIYTKVLSKHG